MCLNYKQRNKPIPPLPKGHGFLGLNFMNTGVKKNNQPWRIHVHNGTTH